MELRQLEYFVAVAEAANFTRAAERVHISQSGISAQIRQLEADLGATLLDRSTRRAALTPAGAAALSHARAALASVDALRQAVDEINGLIRGRLVVGMVTACTITPLFDVLDRFHRAHPGIDITLVEDDSDRLSEAVRRGHVDLALIGAAGGPPDGLEAIIVASERLVAAVPPDHPLATRQRMELSELAGYPLVCMPPGTGLRAVLDQACASRAVRLDIALQATAPGTLADLALRGLGVAVLAESMAAEYAPRLTAVALDHVDIAAVLAIIWGTNDRPALAELVRHCRQVLDPTGSAPTTSAVP